MASVEDDFVMVSPADTPKQPALVSVSSTPADEPLPADTWAQFDSCDVTRNAIGLTLLQATHENALTPTTTAASMSVSPEASHCTETVAVLTAAGAPRGPDRFGVVAPILLPQRWDGEIPLVADEDDDECIVDDISEEIRMVTKAVATCIARAGGAAFEYAASLFDGPPPSNYSYSSFVPPMLHVDGYVPIASHDVCSESGSDEEGSPSDDISHGAFLMNYYLRAMEGALPSADQIGNGRASQSPSHGKDFDFAE